MQSAILFHHLGQWAKQVLDEILIDGVEPEKHQEMAAAFLASMKGEKNNWTKAITAFHEAGHAGLFFLLFPENTVSVSAQKENVVVSSSIDHLRISHQEGSLRYAIVLVGGLVASTIYWLKGAAEGTPWLQGHKGAFWFAGIAQFAQTDLLRLRAWFEPDPGFLQTWGAIKAAFRLLAENWEEVERIAAQISTALTQSKETLTLSRPRPLRYMNGLEDELFLDADPLIQAVMLSFLFEDFSFERSLTYLAEEEECLLCEANQRP